MTFTLLTWRDYDGDSDSHWLFEKRTDALDYVRRDALRAIEKGEWDPRPHDRNKGEPKENDVDGIVAYLDATNSWVYDDDRVWIVQEIEPLSGPIVPG